MSDKKKWVTKNNVWQNSSKGLLQTIRSLYFSLLLEFLSLLFQDYYYQCIMLRTLFWWKLKWEHNAMTCYWDGVIKSLEKPDCDILGLKDRNIYTLIDRLKALNCRTLDMKWQNAPITSSQMDENMVHIKDYPRSGASQGYLCSTFDPFLFLLSFLLKKPVHMDYCGSAIKYEPKICSNTPLKYRCNRGHFWNL